ncbi:hypothetical protein GCM10023083_55660 [Streptomyces phyllanthi]
MKPYGAFSPAPPRLHRWWSRVAAMVAATLAIGMLTAVNPAPAEAATVDINAWYVLINRTSSKAVEVQGASTADDGNVVQYTDWGGANQQWQMIKLSSSGGGCGSAPTLASGTHTIQSGGKSRGFILRVPANYDNNLRYRLIFAFHWRGGTAGDVASGGTSGNAWSYYGQQEQVQGRPQSLQACLTDRAQAVSHASATHRRPWPPGRCGVPWRRRSGRARRVLRA